MAREVFDPNATDGDGDGVVQDGTKFERPAGTAPEGFDPEAKDGDGDGMVQDGTEFERPVDEPAIVEEKLEAAPEPVEPEAPKTPKKEEPKPEPAKKKPAPAKADSDKVALFSTKNAYWEGLGRLSRGHNIVSKEDASQWLTLGYVREATVDEIKAL
jgi:hypothetical protein